MKRYPAVFAAAVALASAVAGCDLPFGSDYNYGSVAVRVTDTDGVGVGGVGLALEAIGYRDLDYGVTGDDGGHRFVLVTSGGRAVRVEELPDGYRLAPGERSVIPFALAEGESTFVPILVVREDGTDS